jgi:hypothetical protein
MKCGNSGVKGEHRQECSGNRGIQGTPRGGAVRERRDYAFLNTLAGSVAESGRSAGADRAASHTAMINRSAPSRA